MLHDNKTYTIAIFLLVIAGTISFSLIVASLIEWILRRFF